MKNLIFIVVGFCLLAFSCQKEPKSGFEVIEIMKAKYNNTFYTNFTFAQHVNKYENDSITSKEIWHEAYSFPNKLLIKFEGFDTGNGIIFRNDSLYLFKDNLLVTGYKRLHDLIVLGLDIYELPTEEIYSKIKELDYDLNKICSASINGRPMYCIGVSNENEQANKFYIDKEFLYFVKNTKYQKGDINETVFSNYQNIDGKLVATKILFYKNGKLIMDEEYYDIKFPKNLDLSIFEPSNFVNVIW
ncbi:MAG: hypothetical protein RBT49_01855 [Bacteroidales bacterium]|jgi:hypothetical protein|nr:hypothetical protein [Bacteroidales bacterium]